MSLAVVRARLELIRLWLNQILTIIIELSLHTNLLDVLFHVVIVAVPAEGLEGAGQFLSV